MKQKKEYGRPEARAGQHVRGTACDSPCLGFGFGGGKRRECCQFTEGCSQACQRSGHSPMRCPFVSRAALGGVDLPLYFGGSLGLWFTWPVIGHHLLLPEVSQHSGGINPFIRAGVQLQLCQDLAWVGGSTEAWQLLLPRPRSPSLCSLSQPGCGPRWSPRFPTKNPTVTSSSLWVTQPEPQLRLSSSTASALGQVLRGEGPSLGAGVSSQSQG